MRQDRHPSLIPISAAHGVIGLALLVLYANAELWKTLPARDAVIRIAVGILGAAYVVIAAILLVDKRGFRYSALIFSRVMHIGIIVVAACLLPACLYIPLGIILIMFFYLPAVIPWLLARRTIRRLKEILANGHNGPPPLPPNA